MRLTERTPVPDAALPIEAMKAHLRLGSGFGDEGLQDGLIAGYLRAALAAIEGRTGKALIARGFRLELEGWRDAGGQTLPVAPVGRIEVVRILDAAGGAVTVDAARLRLVPDPHRPRLVPAGTALPAVPTGGRAEIDFEAGFGAAWEAVPPDLRQAVLMLGAHVHEFRHEAGIEQGAAPFGVAALIERWRNVRVLGGGAR